MDLGYEISEKNAINQIVRQGRSLSPHPFNVYIDRIIGIGRNRIKTEINLGDIMFSSILFADDCYFFQDSEDNLQRAVFTLAYIEKDNNLKV